MKEDIIIYPVAFNGKVRFNIELDAGTKKDEIEKIVTKDPRTIKRLDGKPIRKTIVIPGKMVNIVS